MKQIDAFATIMPNIDEYSEMIKSIWANRQFTNNGPLLKEFEHNLSLYLGTDKINLYVNGHAALDIAIKSLNLTGEVITTSFTFTSPVNAIILNQLTPVFCDINENDYTIDTDKIESLITDKTSAILPVHIFGHPCNVNEIQRIAKKHNLKVIYDGAQAFGSKIENQHIAHFGDLTMFSFHAAKVMNSIEGGLLINNTGSELAYLNKGKNFGLTYLENGIDISQPGLNAKMNEFQAAMGILNLKYLDSEINERKKLSDIYIDILHRVPGIKTINYQDNIDYNYAYFPIIIEKENYGRTRDDLYRFLARNNIATRRLYANPVHSFSYYKENFTANVPVTEQVSNSILDLPLYSYLNDDIVINICKLIQNFQR